jgi:uncharacterized membrane protein HdeD (DUF308 family)
MPIMKAIMARNWWLQALRGIAAIVLGLAAWLWPDQTMIPLVIFFGVFAVIDGALNVAVVILLAQDEAFRWLPLAIGIVGALLGIVIIAGRDIASIGLTYVIAIWAIVMGGFNILTSVALFAELPGAWPLAFMGIISVLFGVAVGITPDVGAQTLAGLIGTFAVLYGILALTLAVRLRAASHDAVMSTATPPGDPARDRAAGAASFDCLEHIT